MANNFNKGAFLTIVLLTLINIFLFYLNLSGKSVVLVSFASRFNIDAVKNYLVSFGSLSPIIFIMFHILQTIIAPIPGTLLIIVGGLIWGPYIGTLLSVTGAFIGSLLCFAISKILGRPFVEKFAKKEDLEIVDKFSQRYGFLAIFILRLIPVMSFDIVSYSAGLTKIDFKKYAIATLLGMIPGTFLYSYIGFSARSLNIIIGLSLIAIGILSFLFLPRIKEFLLSRQKEK